jgi:hypothetical protein
MSTLDTIALFKGIANAHNSGLTALDVIKGHIETLRKGNVKFGKSKATCQYRVQCIDAYAAAFPKTAKKTRDNYVTAVVAAVNDGVEFSFSASKGAAAPKGKGGKAAEKTGTEKMVGALLNVWKLSEVGESTLIEIETIMADGLPLIDAIETVLLAAGEKLDGVNID